MNLRTKFYARNRKRYKYKYTPKNITV